MPLFNEEDVLETTLYRTLNVLDQLEGGPHTLLVVDDGSLDRTKEIVERWVARDSRVRAILLSRNFGHQAALTAALDHLESDVVVLMDADLQDPPEAIPRFVETYQKGYDVVYAKRVRRKEAAWLRASYFAFYRLLSALSGVQLPIDAGDFSLISREVVDVLKTTRERHRYLRGLRAWAGFRQIGLDVERGARAAGESKYTLLKLLRLAFDGILSFTAAPLRLATLVGGLSMLLVGAYGLYALFAYLALGTSPQGFTALLLTVIFTSSVVVFFLGVIGEYVGRIYEEVKGRPIYVVERKLGKEEYGSE